MPLVGVEVRVVFTVARGANPRVPVQASGRRQRGRARPDPTISAVSPAMGLLDVSHDAGPDEFTEPAVAVLAMALVAHLGGSLGVASHGAELAGLGDVVA